MKQFVHDFLLTLLMGIAFLTAADTIIPSFEINEYSIKRDYVNNHASDIKTLIIGNSIATNGIDAQVFGDSCYCFAISGRVLYYDMKLMEEYLPYMTNLKTVILPLHYNLHVHNTTKNYIYNYYRYMGIPYDAFPEGIIYRSAVFSGVFHFHDDGMKFYNEKNGNTMIEDVWNGEKQKLDPPNQQDVEKCITYLTCLATMLEKKGVRFIAVTPPFPDVWLEGCTQDGNDNLFRVADAVNSVSSMEYRCYLSDSMFREDSLYMNWNHLNHHGATQFAQRIMKDFNL